MTEERTLRDSFVVRIWRDKDQAQWKAWVQHTRTGESAFVRDRDELLAFIEARSCELTATPRGGLK
jgi:hypothetical protein